LAHLAFRQTRGQVEVGGGGEIGARAAALDLVDEVEEGRVLRPPVARGEPGAGGAERRRRPGARALVRGAETPHEAGQLRNREEGDQLGAHRPDAVSVTTRPAS